MFKTKEANIIIRKQSKKGVMYSGKHQNNTVLTKPPELETTWQ